MFGPSSSDEELQVDYDSHTPSEGEVQEVPEVQEVRRPRSRQFRRMDESRRAPNPFPERGAADVLATLHRPPDRESNIITNRLDEEQERVILIEERARRQAAEIAKAKVHSEYRFTPLSVEERLKEVAGRSLTIWLCGTLARTPEEIAERDALNQRYLSQKVITREQYLARLRDQARGASVTSMREIPIVLFPNETSRENEHAFEKWVHRVRRLHNIDRLRASKDPGDVRLERKIRFDFAKLKAKGQLRSAFMPDNEGVPIERVSTSVARTTMDRGYTRAADPYMPTSMSGKRRLTQVDPELGAQKRQRRTGNLAEEVPQTPKSFPRVDTQATSPDTGIGPYDDVALEASPRETGDSLARQVTQGGPKSRRKHLML